MAGNLNGNLLDVGLLEIFQLLSSSHLSGVLTLRGKGKKAEIYFSKGEVVSAKCGDFTGFDALVCAATFESGYFVFEKKAVRMPDEIGRSVESLIPELFQIKEEWSKILEHFGGTTDAVPSLLLLSSDSVSVSKEELNIIKYIDEKRSVGEIAREAGVTEYYAGKIISELIDKGLVRIIDVKKKKLPTEPVVLTVGIVRNIMEGEDGLWMSRILGMAPRSLIDEFENEYVVWIDVKLVGNWERKLGKRIFSVLATTPKFEEVVLQISPQISLEDNIVFHEKMAQRLELKEGDKITVVPNIQTEGGE